MNRPIQSAFFALLISGSLGCAKASVSTEIKADGSFTRIAKFSNANMGGLPGGGSQQQTKQETARDIFQIPQSGPSVSVTNKTENGQETVTVSRTVGASASPLTDIVLQDKAKKPTFTSTASVKRLDGGQLQYTETLHWSGAPHSEIDKFAEMARPFVKKALPQQYQVTEKIDGISHALADSVMHAFFGPPEPMLASFMMEPDAAAHKLLSQVFTNFSAGIGIRLSLGPEESAKIARDILGSMPKDELTNQVNPDKQMNSASSGDDDRGLTPLTFIVKYPGKLVRTDGLVDPITGEVYWSMFAGGAQFGDVTLNLVIDPHG